MKKFRVGDIVSIANFPEFRNVLITVYDVTDNSIKGSRIGRNPVSGIHSISLMVLPIETVELRYRKSTRKITLLGQRSWKHMKRAPR